MNRLQKIAQLVRSMDLDALLLTHEENMQYATLFPHLEGMVLVLRSGEGVCFTDSRYIENATLVMAPQGYRVIEPAGSYPTVGTIRDFVAEAGIRTLGYEDEKMTVAQFEAYRAALPCEMAPLGGALSRLRQVKENREIEWLRRAQAIAEKALSDLLPDIRPGAYEDELAAKLTYLMNLGGSEGAPLPIFVSGKKSSMPHGRPSHKAIEPGDFVTIDMGAVVNGYMSDMTRTFAVGHATDEMRAVYATVLEAQAAGLAAFAEGMRGHGLGHSLGLNIHEDPRASRTYTGTFPARSIVTIEPGIYLPGRFGVRIEDMVWLAPGGKENLTHFPKELTILG